MQRQPRILDGDASAGDRARKQREALRGAAADDDRARIGDHAAHAAQVLGERPPQLAGAARVRVAEGSIGSVAQGLAQRAQPRPARERREVGVAREEVERGRAPRRLDGGGRRGARGARHERPGAPPGDQVALSEQLSVGVHDQPPRYPKIRRQRASGGQARVRRQAPRAHRIAQPILELRAQRRAGRAV